MEDMKAGIRSFQKFVPADVVKAFLSSNSEATFGGTRRKVTVFFSDIVNFTTISQDLSPEEIVELLREYLNTLSNVIEAGGGTVDKYIGDAIMALFDDADDALRAGLAMHDALEGFNAERRAAGLEPIAIGIGLNSGSLMLGTIGETHRMDGTVISDAVNLASRIESLTKEYHVGLLISQYTYQQLADPRAYDIRPIDVVVVKGKTRPVTIFEVFQTNPPALRAAKGQTRSLLQSGIDALARHDAAAARRCFEECLALAPGDAAASNLLKSCT